MLFGDNPPPSADAQPMVWVMSLAADTDWADTATYDLERRSRLAVVVNDDTIVLVIVGRGFAEACHDQPVMAALMANVLSRGLVVVPLLVDGARMPTAIELPQPLQRLTYCEAIDVGSKSDLLNAITRVLSALGTADVDAEPADPGRSRYLFVMYRRDDTGSWIKPLARRLGDQVGRKNVYVDIGSQVPGHSYRAQIDQGLGAATEYVLLIGPGFLARDSSGKRRIDDVDDQLRNEIRSALLTGKKIHILVTADAVVPDRSELPDDIAALADVRVVHRLLSRDSIDAAVKEMFPVEAEPRRQTQDDNRTAMRRPLSRPANTRTPGLQPQPFWSADPAHQRRAESAVRELADLGWRVVTEPKTRSHEITLANDRFDRFRLRIDLSLGGVLLEECLETVTRAGFRRRWVTRRALPLLPSGPTDTTTLRLPDELTEFALDPEQYLRLRGRHEWDEELVRAALSPPGSSHRKRWEDRSWDLDAIESHHQILREIAGEGGAGRSHGDHNDRIQRRA